MSRAFVKENDLEHAGIDIPERPLSDEPNYVTPNGLKLLNMQIDVLEIEREELKKKKDDPIAKQKIAIVERDMRYYAARIESAILTAPKEENHPIVLFGAKVTDPEQKRKIIGREFVEVFHNEAKKIPKAKWLAQGTIYPDVIESASAKTKKAHTIKSHHNVGGLPETLKLKLLEPLRELFKDEVRELGHALDLPKEMVYRHPFPGPGLGVRILGEVTSEFADLLRRADTIFIEELTDSGWYEKTSQAFAVFLPVKSVGVMGDGRTYEYVVALRAVVTSDFMTAHWAELPYALLGKVSNRIINEVRGINRVVYDISGKPPATIEWE